MSDYSSQPVEDIPLKRAGRPLWENSLAGRLVKVQGLHDQGFKFGLTVTCTNVQVYGKTWEEVWEVGAVDPKCFATTIDLSEKLSQDLFVKKANTLDFEVRKFVKDKEEKEREASQLARKRAHFENLSVDFAPSSVRHLI
jgi:hypothetical protein